MKVQINTEKEYYRRDGLMKGLIVEVEYMGPNFGGGNFYKAIGIDHRYYLTREDFVVLDNN
ncbi:hypothetical protein [Parabacteroides provencensis]|uniref:hypothetical protein n=1 Tax=Parabacteroides provencensis TaxID=1944636 RepID=UPI000C150003|nr:hypothetical protein [Parabacteroides provencensis]